MNQRDYSFDFCKGVLIFLVVYGHVLPYYLNENYLSNGVYTLIYSFHMPAFFIISGFFSRKAVNNSIWQCVCTKFKRLALPAFFWSLFSILMNYFQFMSSEPISRIIVSSFRTTWFLWTLFLFFVLASIIWKSKYKFFIAVILSIILWMTHRWQNPYIFDYLHISREWPCFLVGLLFAEYRYAGKQLARREAILVWFLALLVYCIEYYRYVNNYGGYETRCILLLAAGIVFLPIIKVSYNLLLKISPRITSFIVKLGGVSMGIYLIDGIGKKIVNSFLGDILHTNALLLVPFAILCAFVWYFLVILIRENKVVRRYLLGERD